VNFSTYVMTIRHYLETENPEWVIIGYLPVNDLVPVDTMREAYMLHRSRPTGHLRSCSGRKTVSRMIAVYNGLYMKYTSGARKCSAHAAEARELGEIAAGRRVLVYSYFEDDGFPEYVRRTSGGRVETMIFKLPPKRPARPAAIT